MAFDDLSPNTDQEYFAQGLSEEIISVLARVDGLHVVGRTSAFAFKGSDHDLRTIADKLNVGTVLEGSVRKSGDRLRITAQLVDAKTGFQLFSESYDRPLGDVFAIQDEIAREVVGQLAQTLPDLVAPATATRSTTTDPKAYEAYTRGMFFYWQYSNDSTKRALLSFQEALARDPDYALAHAGASLCHTWLAGFSVTKEQIRPPNALERRREEPSSSHHTCRRD